MGMAVDDDEVERVGRELLEGEGVRLPKGDFLLTVVREEEGRRGIWSILRREMARSGADVLDARDRVMGADV